MGRSKRASVDFNRASESSRAWPNQQMRLNHFWSWKALKRPSRAWSRSMARRCTSLPGEVHAIIGQNGAGKSTLIKILNGAYRRDAGTIVLEGQPVDFHNPQEAQLGGVSTIYQEINLVPYRSVAENIFMGREPRRWGLLDRERMNRDATAVLERLGVQHRRATAAQHAQHRVAADGRHRAGDLDRCAHRHHGRADLVARRTRGRGPVRRDPRVSRLAASR